MDELESILKRYFDEHEARENLVHADLLDRLDRAEKSLDSVRHDLGVLKRDAEEQKTLLGPLVDFLRGLEAASNLGRTVRLAVGWLAFLGASGSLVYLAWQAQNTK